MSRRSHLFAALAVLVIAGCESAGGGAEVGELSKRIKKLEENVTHNAEAMEFLQSQYKRIKAQQEQQDAQEPAEDAIFAVDITGNQFEGPASGAYVTIVEAWDFA